MRRFQFRLATVERFREDKEKEALRVLASAQQKLHEAMMEKEELVSKLNQALEERESLGSSPVGIVAFQIQEDFIVGSKYRILHSDRMISRERRTVEKAMAYYLKLRRDRMMISKLRERAFEKYKKEMSREEQKRQDDLYIMRFRMTGEAS